MAIFGPIILLFMLGLVASLTIFLVEWMLFPLKAGVIDPKNKKQFFLSDMYVLILQLAITGLIASQLSHRESHGLPIIVGLWALLILLWLIGISMLSRAGVTRAWPRAVSLCIAIPGAYVGSFFAASGVAAFSLFTMPFVIPILFVGVILLYGLCNSIAEWAINSKYSVQSKC